MTPYAICSAAALAWMVTGQLVLVQFLALASCSQVVNQALKRFFQQARPDPLGGGHGCGLWPRAHVTWGMPSGHAQLAFMAAMYWSLHMPQTWRCWLLWTTATVVSWQRVWCGCHSVAQIAVGAALGLALGTA